MITANREQIEEGRGAYALTLLESSGYIEPWKSEIADAINDSSIDEIELIIQDLLLNQVDLFASYRLRDINRRLDAKGNR